MSESLPQRFEQKPASFRTSVMNIDRPGDASVFGDSVRADAAEIIARYPQGQSRSALLPMLHLVQSEQGYITADGIAFCADILGITKAQVAAVATFYTMYKRQPTGEYLVSICTNTLCGMLGGDEIYKEISEFLGVGMNETTGDGKITLEHAECLAACDYAPVVTVNYEFFDNQTPESAAALVKDLQAGTRPLPTRGAPLCSFREIERQIAGFLDPRPEALEAEATGAPTEAGVKLAAERGESAPAYGTVAAVATPAPATTQTATPAAVKAEPAAKAEPVIKAEPAEAAPVKDEPAVEVTSAHDAPLKTSASDPDVDESQPAAVVDDVAPEQPQIPGVQTETPRRRAKARVRRPAQTQQTGQLSLDDQIQDGD